MANSGLAPTADDDDDCRNGDFAPERYFDADGFWRGGGGGGGGSLAAAAAARLFVCSTRRHFDQNGHPGLDAIRHRDAERAPFKSTANSMPG